MQSACSGEIRKGRYVVQPTIPAKKVSISSMQMVSATSRKYGGTQGIRSRAENPSNVHQEAVPEAKYNAKTELTIEVKESGKNEFPVQLDDEVEATNFSSSAASLFSSTGGHIPTWCGGRSAVSTSSRDRGAIDCSTLADRNRRAVHAQNSGLAGGGPGEIQGSRGHSSTARSPCDSVRRGLQPDDVPIRLRWQRISRRQCRQGSEESAKSTEKPRSPRGVPEERHRPSVVAEDRLRRGLLRA